MKKLTILVMAIALFTGCAFFKGNKNASGKPTNDGQRTSAAGQANQTDPEIFNTRVVSLASQLSSYLQNYDIASRTIVVTTFVNLDSLKAGNRFGRLLSEQLVFSIHTMGYRVFELRTSKEIKLRENSGEFFLTRNEEELLAPYRPDAVIVGTYQVVGNSVNVQARMIDVATSRIVSVSSVAFKLDEDPFSAQLLTAPPAEDQRSKLEPDRKQDEPSLGIRELVAEEGSTSQAILTQKIDRVSREIARTVKTGRSNQTVAVSTFVDIDRLNRSNTFGRFLAEGLIEGMTRRGLAVVETRAAKRILVQPNVGEHSLTREADEAAEGGPIDAVILGTYTRAGETVYVHARMVLPESRRVVSVASFQMKLGKDDRFMQEMFANNAERLGPEIFHGVKQ